MSYRDTWLIVTTPALLSVILLLTACGSSNNNRIDGHYIEGAVLSGAVPIGSATVTVYSSSDDNGHRAMGSGTTNDDNDPQSKYSALLDRNTAVEIDPSGNVWLTNNWKDLPIKPDPVGDGMVVFIGMAAPVKSPRIGTPEQP